MEAEDFTDESVEVGKAVGLVSGRGEFGARVWGEIGPLGVVEVGEDGGLLGRWSN